MVKNLSEKSERVRPDGWAREDWARQLLDYINAEAERTGMGKGDWRYEEMFNDMYDPRQHAFAMGFMLAAAWQSGAISGGKLRDVLRQSEAVKPEATITLQRLLEHCEAMREKINE